MSFGTPPSEFGVSVGISLSIEDVVAVCVGAAESGATGLREQLVSDTERTAINIAAGRGALRTVCLACLRGFGVWPASGGSLVVDDDYLGQT